MTNPEISEAAKAKAYELVQDEYARDPSQNAVPAHRTALARHIQNTSDVAKEALRACSPFDDRQFIKSLILPEPKDPLEEAFRDVGFFDPANLADDVRAAIAKRGGKITFD